MLKKIFIFFVVISIPFIYIKGCKNDDSGSSFQSPVDSGLEKGIFHFGNGSEPQGIDPHIVTGVPEHHILISLCEGLTIPNPNPTGSDGYIPGTAESWTISDDGKELIYVMAMGTSWVVPFDRQYRADGFVNYVTLEDERLVLYQKENGVVKRKILGRRR